MKVLIVDDESATRDLVSLVLNKMTSIDPVLASSGNEAIRFLRSGMNFDLIVSDYSMSDGTGGDLFLHLKKSQIKTPFVLCSSEDFSKLEDFRDADISAFVDKKNLRESLSQIFQTLTILHKKVKATSNVFIPVQVDTFLRLKEMPCDAFVKLGDDKYVRVFKTESAINLDAAKRYRAKGIHSLFIDFNSIDLMIEKILESIVPVSELDKTKDVTTQLLKVMNKIDDENLKKELVHLNTQLNEARADNQEYEKSVKASEMVHKAIQQAIQKIGATREVEQLIKATVKLSIETISSTPELSSYYAVMTVNPADYLNSHSILLAHYACLFADKMGLATEMTRYKLTLAAMLHDITLPDDKMAKLSSRHDVVSSNFTNQEKEKILNHSLEAAQLVRGLNQIPPDVDKLIENHHAWSEGGGFPKDIAPEELDLTTGVLIFAHELTDWIFENQGSPYAYQNFFVKNRKKYSAGVFKKIFTTITGHSPEIRNVKLKAV